jgi:hypothetical protein
MGAHHFRCRNCGQLHPKTHMYEGTDWCAGCVTDTLDRQEREMLDRVQRRQVVTWEPDKP